MNENFVPILFIALAALFSGAWTHYSLMLAAGTALLAALMFFFRVLPLDDRSPTKTQQAAGLVFIAAMCAGIVLEARCDLAYWFMQSFTATASSYFGVIFIRSVVAGWKKT
jgi:hypothetical protein